MKQFLLVTLLVLGLAGVATAQSVAFTNSAGYTAPPNPGQIDTLKFINLAPFDAEFGTVFDFTDVLVYTNRSSMASSGGFIFDDAPANAGVRRAAQTFGNANQGTIQGNALLEIFATNIVNSGELDVAATGVLVIGGNNVDLHNGVLNVGNGAIPSQGIFDDFFGTGFQTNLLSPDDVTPGTFQSPRSKVTSVTGGPSTLQVEAQDGGAFAYTTMVNPSNFIYQIVYVKTNIPNIMTSVHFDPGTGGDGVTPVPTVPVVEFSTLLTNANGTVVTQFLTLMDLFGNIQTNYLTNTETGGSGIPLSRPFNYLVSRNDDPVTGTNQLANTTYDPVAIFQIGMPTNAFPVTNVYSAYQVEIHQYNIPDPTEAGSVLTNVAGRLLITATNSLDLSHATVVGPTYVSVIASNHFVGSQGAQIVAPFEDINVGSTNGTLTVTNLIAKTLPGMDGTLSAYSARWTNTINGITNTWNVLYVEADLSTTINPQVLNFAARSTNLLISDTLNVAENALVLSQNVTVITNGAGQPNQSPTFFLENEFESFSASFPLLQNLTNFSTIEINGNADFIGNRLPPYFTNTFTEPLKSIVNHGGIFVLGATFDADYFESSGPLSFIDAENGAINLFAGTAVLTNDTLQADSDVSLVVTNLTAFHHVFDVTGSLTFSIAGSLIDGGVNASNFWEADDGMNLLVAPAIGDFLGSTILLTSPAGKEVDISWIGSDRGPTVSGFVNNGAFGQVTLDGGSSRSSFSFGPADGNTNHAIYIDQIVLADGATNHNGNNYPVFDVPQGFKVYYADAKIFGGADISQQLQQGNPQLVWVPAFAGIFSGTPLVSGGQTNLVNRALLNSTNIDSDGDGIPNASDPTPFFTSSSVKLAIKLTNSVSGPAIKVATISWTALANSTNALFFGTNILSTNWIQVLSTNQGTNTGVISVKQTNGPGFYKVVETPAQP